MRRTAITGLDFSSRSGTTLVEVLMSLLIMGIGLVSVATLFPLSVLRSVEATQQTTATTLRYTAEALIDASWTDPVYDTSDEDGDTDTGELAYNRRQGMPAFPNPSTLLTGSPRAAIVLDPDADHDPQVNDTNVVAGVSVYDPSDHVEGAYVVDPLGYWRLRQQALTHDDARHFGSWVGVGGPIIVDSVVYNINRFSLNQTDTTHDIYNLYGFTGLFDGVYDPTATPPKTHIDENADRAAARFSSPDSFVTVADGFPQAANITANSVRFDSGEADFTAFLIGGSTPDWIGLARGQVTVFSRDGRRSVVRQLDTTTDTAGTHNWGSAEPDLNSRKVQFTPDLPIWLFDAGNVNNVGRVTVETADDRYTWMLTVRNQNYKGVRRGLVDVVVFHRRAFGGDDERVYFVGQNFGSVTAFNRRKQEVHEYVVAWDSASDPRPEVDEGEWMFDPLNFRWYKIGQVEDESSFTLTPEARDALGVPATATLDRQIVFRLEGPAQANEKIQRGIFMQGIVDVYPIEPKVSNK